MENGDGRPAVNVLARSGPYAFLVELERGRGVVLDISAEPTVSQVMSIDAVSNSGRWESFDGDSSRVIELAWRVLGDGVELPTHGFDVAGGARRLPQVHVAPEDLDAVTMVVCGFGVSELRPGNAATFQFGDRVGVVEPTTASVA
jgi:hypothetical protein